MFYQSKKQTKKRLSRDTKQFLWKCCRIPLQALVLGFPTRGQYSAPKRSAARQLPHNLQHGDISSPRSKLSTPGGDEAALPQNYGVLSAAARAALRPPPGLTVSPTNPASKQQLLLSSTDQLARCQLATITAAANCPHIKSPTGTLLLLLAGLTGKQR